MRLKPIKAAALATAVAFLLSLGSAAAWAAPAEYAVEVPAGAQSFEIELSVNVGGEPFAGIEFGITISGQDPPDFVSFQKGAAYSDSLDASITYKGGVHYFGFLSDANKYSGGRLDVGRLAFDGYTGDGTAYVTLSYMQVVRVTPGKDTVGEEYDEALSVYAVRRAGPGGGGSGDGDGNGSGGGGSGGGGGGAQPPSAGADAGADGAEQDEAEGPTLIGDEGSPLGLAFLKDHIRYINGYPDGTVRPDDSITRAEAAAIFHRLIDDDAKEAPDAGQAPAAFGDVPSGAWYAQPIAYAARKGIVIGYPDGGFHPDDNITRAEFATIMSRFVPAAGSSQGMFPDVPQSHWAAQSIRTCAANGWIIGYPDGTFGPENEITRAEAVAIMNRSLGRGIAPEDIPEGAPSYGDLPKGHWAYAQIIEASVTHGFAIGVDGKETWTDLR